MILITGGAFQGKTEFAKTFKEYFADAENPVIVDGAQADECGIIEQAEIITQFHLYIRRLLEQGRDAAKETEKLLRLNPDLIIEVTELGCGVVPVDAFDRIWRETTGRVSCTLAKQAQTVYRVNCGIASQLK